MSCLASASLILRGSVSFAVISRVLVERLDGRFVGDRQRDHVAPFVRLADPEQLHARRRLLQRLVVAHDVGVIREVARLAGDVAEKFQRRRHGRRGRHVVHQLGDDPRIGCRLLDPGGVILVQLLGRRGDARTALRVDVTADAVGGQRDQRQNDRRALRAPAERRQAHEPSWRIAGGVYRYWSSRRAAAPLTVATVASPERRRGRPRRPACELSRR